MIRKFALTAAVVGTVGLAACSSGGKGGSTAAPVPDAAASTFTDEATTIAAECPDPDAGLMSTESGIFPPNDFCKLYLATCSSVKNALTDMASCLESYNSAATLPSGDMQHCRSNHVCNAAVFFPAQFVMHCGHAIGIGLCN